MVKWLIRIVGTSLARRIERGSISGAMFGVIVGAMIGLAIVLGLDHTGIIARDFAVSSLIVSVIAFGLIGAMLGAAVGTRPAPLEARIGVRLTRYNRAAGSLAIAGILCICAIGLFVVPDNQIGDGGRSSTSFLAIACVIVLLALAAAFVAVREIWCIELGTIISVRRLLARQNYPQCDLQMWGFELRPNEVVQQPFEGSRVLCLQFTDGRIVRIETRGEDSRAVVQTLSRTGVNTESIAR